MLAETAKLHNSIVEFDVCPLCADSDERLSLIARLAALLRINFMLMAPQQDATQDNACLPVLDRIIVLARRDQYGSPSIEHLLRGGEAEVRRGADEVTRQLREQLRSILPT